ncbi:MAG: immunity 17 family protein [Ruminococcus sp.]|nr:immunity 17 family protein [Ruminococcus sp.]
MESIIIILVGVFILAAAYFEWDWFFNNYKARPIVALFGRNGARIFYGVLGGLFVVGGLVFF